MQFNLKSLFFLLALGLLLSACESPHEPVATETETEWGRQVAAIAVGETGAERGAAIVARLQKIGLDIQRQAFARKGMSGTNLLAYVSGPADAPLLLIGAHYDRVDVGRGVTDNASGSAAVLALAKAFKKKPLKNHRVVVAFWDLEEKGLLGSQHWVETADAPPALYINFDVFGWGNTIWMMAPQKNMPIADAVRAAAQGSGVETSIGSAYPPTDHLAFLHVKWPAVSFSLVGNAEIPGILQLFAGEKPDTIPKVMSVIHTPNDRMDQIVEADAVKAIPVIETAIREWDDNINSR